MNTTSLVIDYQLQFRPIRRTRKNTVVVVLEVIRIRVARSFVAQQNDQNSYKYTDKVEEQMQCMTHNIFIATRCSLIK